MKNGSKCVKLSQMVLWMPADQKKFAKFRTQKVEGCSEKFVELIFEKNSQNTYLDWKFIMCKHQKL